MSNRVALNINTNHFETLRGNALSTHVTCHFLALEDTPRAFGTDRANPEHDATASFRAWRPAY
jgi:hypothetical protein